MSDTAKSWLFVTVQAILLVALVILPNPAPTASHVVLAVRTIVEIIGSSILALSLYDLRRSLTVMPVPVPHGQLQIHGLYRWVRHPMYTGVMTLSLGIAIGSNYWLKYAIVFGLVLLFNFKARFEESLLRAKYPGYAAYMRRTPRFLPRLVKNDSD